MNIMKEQPFYIGQKVIAIENGRTGVVVKGSVYIVKDIIKSPCGCWSIDVGFKNDYSYTRCKLHNQRVRNEKDDIMWSRVKIFAPIEDGFQSISFSKVMEEELTSVN